MRNYKRKEPAPPDKIQSILLLLSYVIFPFIFYPIMVEKSTPIIIGLVFWALSPIILPGYAFISFVNWALQFTF